MPAMSDLKPEVFEKYDVRFPYAVVNERGIVSDWLNLTAAQRLRELHGYAIVKLMAPAIAHSKIAPSISGIDVSMFQGWINWSQVIKRSAMAFAYIKATEGLSLADPRFLLNWENAKAADLKIGAYHFFHPIDDAQRQAKYLIDILATGGFSKGDLLPVVDLEETGAPHRDEWPLFAPSAAQSKVLEFCQTLADAYGKMPILYTRTNWVEGVLPGFVWQHFYWLAEYVTGAPGVLSAVSYPKDWPVANCKLWQYTNQGSVPGIGGNVDQNRFLGADLAEITL